MNELKTKMIHEAQSKYQTIFPCASQSNLDECFTIEGDRVLFWFNTEDCTTHIIASQL
jgi:hypothetical protein